MPTSAHVAIARYCHSTWALLSSSARNCHLSSRGVSRGHSPLNCPSLEIASVRCLHSHLRAPLPAARTPFLTCVSPIFMSIALEGPPEGYRPNVGLCLINADGQIFVARRIDLPDSWQMPQGGVDENEEPRLAALRELQEETGVTTAEIIGEVAEWVTYDFPPDVKAKLTRLWGKEWEGQAQKWYLFMFQGDEKEINLNSEGIERAEFSDWKWASADEVLSRAVDFKRPVYEKVLKAFSPSLKWDSAGVSSQAETA